MQEERKKIVNVRGGLSKEGIVRSLPEEMIGQNLDQVIKYAINEDSLKNQQEKAVADSIKTEMRKGQYVIVLNGIDTVTANKIEQEILSKYMQTQKRELEDGREIEYDYADIAIAGVQEGGYNLEKRI